MAAEEIMLHYVNPFQQGWLIMLGASEDVAHETWKAKLSKPHETTN
jgi:hypothetical protein